MSYEIDPLAGVGALRFGMSKDDVQAAMKTEGKSFDKTAGQDAELFPEPGIVVYYDPAGLVEAVEFFGPDNPTYQGDAPLGMSAERAQQWMKQIDPAANMTIPDLTSDKLGIALYVPEDKVSSVLAFKQGYLNGATIPDPAETPRSVDAPPIRGNPLPADEATAVAPFTPDEIDGYFQDVERMKGELDG